MLFGFFIVFILCEFVNGTPPWAPHSNSNSNTNLNVYGTRQYQPHEGYRNEGSTLQCPPPVSCPKLSGEHDSTQCPTIQCPAVTTCNCPVQKCLIGAPKAHLPRFKQPQDIQSPPPHAHHYEMPTLTVATKIYPIEPSDLTPLKTLPDTEIIEAHTGTPLEETFYKDTVLPTTPSNYELVATPKTLTDYADEKTNEVAQTPRPKLFTKPPVTLSHEKLLQHNNRLQTLFATEAPFRRRYLKRFRFSKKTFGTPTLTARDKGRCNSLKLKMIMMENIEKTPTVSKRAIQKAASAEIGGSFDVVCSKHDFSYLANTRLYCETRIADIVCFAFMHEPEKETSFKM